MYLYNLCVVLSRKQGLIKKYGYVECNYQIFVNYLMNTILKGGDFLKFHEDLIFKGESQQYGQELIELINIEGKIIELLPTEYPDIEAKIYKPDLVLELEDRILILEFQSTYVDSADQRRFRHYTSILDINLIKSEKKIELHVLSTIEQEQVKIYKVNDYSNFIICIHSLKSYDANEVLNEWQLWE